MNYKYYSIQFNLVNLLDFDTNIKRIRWLPTIVNSCAILGVLRKWGDHLNVYLEMKIGQ